MHGAWRGRATAAALVVSVAAGLVACHPGPGGATLTVTGAVEADDPEGSVTCRPPGDGGETYIPTWEWNGTIDGEAASLMVSSQSAHVPNQGVLTVGTRSWVHLYGTTGEVVTERIDDDGTLHVTATLTEFPGTSEVEITAALRCPSWGHATLTGTLAGTIDGLADCDVPSGSDAYSTYEIASGNLEGRLNRSITFGGLSGPAVDTAVLLDGGVAWGAFNRPGEPPQVRVEEQADGVLIAGATLTPPRRWSGHDRGRRRRPLHLIAEALGRRQWPGVRTRRGRWPRWPARRWPPRGR